MEKLVYMAKKFKEVAIRGQLLGLTEDDVLFFAMLWATTRQP